MKEKHKLFLTAKLLSIMSFLLLGMVASGYAQGTAFTYQGRLDSAGSPANGSYDFAFTLYNRNSSGRAIAGPVTNSATVVNNGLFTTMIDFGPGTFTGASNWLEIAVSTNEANTFTTLAPRQQVTPTPYAIYASNAGTAASASSVAGANILGTIPLAQLPASVITNGASGVNVNGTFSGSFNGNGAGLTNLASTDSDTISWTTNASPYSTNYYSLDVVSDFTNHFGYVQWLSAVETNGLISGFVPDIGNAGFPYYSPLAANLGGFQFDIFGDQCAITLYGGGTSFNLQVNGGSPIAFSNVIPGDGNYYTLFLKFPSIANRLLRIEGGDLDLTGLAITNTESFLPVLPHLTRILLIGDSFLGGANGVNPEDTFGPDLIKIDPILDVWVDAVGGTGYSAGGSAGTNNYLNRFLNFDTGLPYKAVIFTGTVNDSGSPSNTYSTFVYNTLYAAKTNYPKTFVGVVLPINNDFPLSTGSSNTWFVVRAQCHTLGIPYLDPTGAIGTNGPPGNNPWNQGQWTGSDGTHPSFNGDLFYAHCIYPWLVSNMQSSAVNTNAAYVPNGNSGPAIIRPPASQTIALNARFTNTVVASGSPPLAYQWTLWETNLPGATNAIYANVLTASAVGPYAVTVTNLYGTITSLAATNLTMPVPPDIFWAKFNEGRGTVFQDSANGYNGNIVSSSQWVSAGFAYAITNNGTSQFAYTTNNLIFNTNIITISFWIYPAGGNSTPQDLIESSVNYAGGAQLFTMFENGDSVSWMASYHAIGYDQLFFQQPAYNLWHHILWMINASTAVCTYKVFVDGSLQNITNNPVGGGAVGGLAPISNQQIYMMSRGGGSFFNSGSLDDVRIYSGDRSVSVTNIMADHQ